MKRPLLLSYLRLELLAWPIILGVIAITLFFSAAGETWQRFVFYVTAGILLLSAAFLLFRSIRRI